MMTDLHRGGAQVSIFSDNIPTAKNSNCRLGSEVIQPSVAVTAIGPVLEIDQRIARCHQGPRSSEAGGERTQQELERMIREFASHAPTARILLHALQSVEHDQVRPSIA